MVFLVRKTDRADVAPLDQRWPDLVRGLKVLQITYERPVGFPLLFDREGRLIEAAVDFLHSDIALRGATESTVRTYSECLFDWFETVEQNGWDWKHIGIYEVAQYRDRMLRHKSPSTRRSYAVATINLRVRVVEAFYKWAHRCQIVQNPICVEPMRCTHAKRRAHGMRFGSRGSDSLVLTQHESLPKPLSPDQARELRAAVESPFDLMVDWQMTTGARVAELIGLSVNSLRGHSGGLAAITIIRKGRKKGELLVPRALLDATRFYIDVTRRMFEEKSKQPRTNRLFVTPAGRPVSINWYQRNIRLAGRKLGFRATPHILRASFACCMLAKLKLIAAKGVPINPTLVVKILMGHSRVETTDRYLRVIEVYEPDVRRALAAAYASTHAP